MAKGILILILATFAVFIAADIWLYYQQPVCPDVQPLKVTVLDDGGAKLKVTSEVKLHGCRKK
jgi:hypothetical protein